MKPFFKERAVELVLTVIAFCWCVCFSTIVLDDYGSFAYLSMPTGQYCNYPHIDHCYNAFLLVNSFYKFISVAFPAYNGMGISFMVLQLLSLYLLLRSIKNSLLQNEQPLYMVRVVQILFACFYLENILILSHTRFSLLFCGTALFNLAFTPVLRKRDILLNSMLFILGMLHRPESSMGMLALVGMGFLIHRFDVVHLLKRFFIPASSTVLLFTVFAIDWQHTDVFVKKIEPEIEYKIMDKRVVSLAEMKTAQDSVKYQAAVIGMWFDTRVLTPEYLRSILLPGINISAEHFIRIFFHVLKLYGHFLFIPFMLASFVLLCLFPGSGRSTLFKIILFQAGVFCLIFALDFNGRLVAGRHFLNLQLISLLITSVYFFSAVRDSNKVVALVCLLCIVGVTVITVDGYKNDADAIAADTTCYEAAMQQLETTFTNRTIVATITNIYLMNHNFTLKNKNYTRNKFLMYDVFNYSLAPSYMAYLSSQCNCDAGDPVAFYTWLAKQKALYMAEHARYELTEGYMKLVHGLPLKFVVPADSLMKPACVSSSNLRYFELRNVVIATRWTR